jgi:NAD(P)-dependent dehydrogenase (short-subunit alcohol dehydrogenase family)
MSDLRFDERVALVTGAGGAIGRAHALLLAERGAKVVVNDYGTTVAGEKPGAADDRAERVAEEIRDLGGEAITNTDSVAEQAGAEQMVKAALEAYGRLDIIVNNAGIAVCDHIHEEPGPRYALNLGVLLEGPAYVIRAAWETMKERGYGRILNTSSAAIFGFHWPDGNWMGSYVLAKAGVMAYTRQIGGQGEAHGIKANAILPLAYSRMNSESLKGTPEGDYLKTFAGPEHVASAAGYLLHEECPVTGQSFSVSGGRIARVLFAEPLGFYHPALTPELVRDNWEAAVGEPGEDNRLSPDFFQIVNLLQESELMVAAGVGSQAAV